MKIDRCPCGGRAFLKREDIQLPVETETWWYVRCETCGVTTIPLQEKELAIQQWIEKIKVEI